MRGTHKTKRAQKAQKELAKRPKKKPKPRSGLRKALHEIGEHKVRTEKAVEESGTRRQVNPQRLRAGRPPKKKKRIYT